MSAKEDEKLFEKLNNEMADRVDLPESLNMKSMCIDYANMVFKQYLIEFSEGNKPQQSDSNCAIPVVSNSFCPKCNGKNIKPYNTPSCECKDCNAYWAI